MAMLLSVAACSERSPGKSNDSSSVSVIDQLESSSSVSLEPEKPEKALIDKIVEAYNKNNDVIGWLRIPNTTIDQPVVQKAGAQDNNYYLKRDITKKTVPLNPGDKNAGVLFLDYECQAGTRKEFNKNTIIYGHNLNYQDDPKDVNFAQLFNYNNEEFAKKNPNIYFSTTDDDMTWVVFAAFYTDINFNYINAKPTDTEFQFIINEAIQRSEYIYDVKVNASDKILTLSTCTYKYGKSNKNQRYVVMARLLRPGETAPETAKITKNPSPKAPKF
ncbi:MAG TPA: hypothetical protein DCP97_04055 [Ruminococcaceae bacterium]|nr:hypothetical protein [Oscillospiraceae bacterium]